MNLVLCLFRKPSRCVNSAECELFLTPCCDVTSVLNSIHCSQDGRSLDH